VPGQIRSYVGFEHMGIGTAPINRNMNVIDRGAFLLQITSQLPGPPAVENPGSSPVWRAYDRVGSWMGLGIVVYHGNQIYALTAPPAWASVHTTTGQNASLGSGLHSGLYAVHSRDGSQMWVCGFYRVPTPNPNGLMGWVKGNTLTGSWTSGTQANLFSPADAFAPCVQFEGELAHCGEGVCTFFNPLTNTIRQELYDANAVSTAWKDKVWVQHGRLYVVAKTSGDILRVLERIAGGVWIVVATLAREDTGSMGDWDIWNPFGTSFFVSMFSTLGGTGWRLFEVTPSPTPAAPATVTEFTAPVFPNVLGANYRFPSAVDANSSQRWQFRADFTDWKIGSFGASGGGFTEIFLQVNALFTTTRLQWSFISTLTALAPTGDRPGLPGVTAHGPSHALHTNRWALADRGVFVNEVTIQIGSVSTYTDGSVTRGLLITFSLQSGSGGSFFTTWDAQILYQLGAAIGNAVGAPGTILPLSAGDGTLDPGGAGATLNLVDDSLDGCFVEYPAGRLLSHGVPSAGPGYSVGETVTSSGTGVGVVQAVSGAPLNRIGVTVTAGVFLATETITGGTSGTISVLSAVNSSFQYSVILEPDLIFAADFDWLALAPTSIPTGVLRPPGPGFTWTGALSYVQVPQTPSTIPPGTTGSPLAQITALTEATPGTTSSPLAQATALASASPGTTSSPLAEAVLSGLFPGVIAGRVPSKAHVRPGWINVELNDAGAGGDQENTSWDDSVSTPGRALGGQGGSVPLGTTEAELQFILRGVSLPEAGLLARIPGVDLTAQADTALYTVPAGSQAIVFGGSVRCEAAAGITTPAEAGIGVNGAADDIFQSQPLVGLKAAGGTFDFPIGGDAVAAGPGSVITFGVDQGALGGTQTGEVQIYGYLLEP
jgi:hypothetical protein